MASEEIYREIYKFMKKSNEKGLKMTLKKNLQGVLFTNIDNTEPSISKDEKSHWIYHTQLNVDGLIKKIILKDGNRSKIELRNFFFKSHRKLWNRYSMF